MGNVRIEYSEDQNWLRLDNYTHEENTNGFVTISDNMDEELASIFCRVVEDISNGQQMSVYSVKEMFNLWARSTRLRQDASIGLNN
jgi:hypothetical protein